MEQRELDPPAHERLSEVRAPTLVLVGALDLEAGAARELAGAPADRVTAAMPAARGEPICS